MAMPEQHPGPLEYYARDLAALAGGPSLEELLTVAMYRGIQLARSAPDWAEAALHAHYRDHAPDLPPSEHEAEFYAELSGLISYAGLTS